MALFERYMQIAVESNLPRAVVHYAYYLLLEEGERQRAVDLLLSTEGCAIDMLRLEEGNRPRVVDILTNLVEVQHSPLKCLFG